MNVAAGLPDSAERRAAIEPGRSCIVQAPAGSGKTELLIQRFLRLLGVVEAPEEIVAITFTRKAAGEMRRRIESALRAARDGIEPEEPHRRDSYAYAQAALERDRECGWNLTNHPDRLRIGTIDAVNAGLARRSPLSAGVTSQNRLAEDILPYYRMAIRETLLMASETDAAGHQVTVFLGHCDNRSDLAERYLLIMLQRRDHWLRHTAAGHIPSPAELRELFEASLRRFCGAYLLQAAGLLPSAEQKTLLTLLQYAATSLATEKPDALLCQWQTVEQIPAPTMETVDLWRSLANFLLTASGTWRKTVNRNQGFPPGSGSAGERKQQMVELLSRLQTHDELRLALENIQQLPDAHYNDAQWALINSLWQVLPLLVAVLKNIFAEQGVTDYTEVALEAIDSLGSADNVSDLRLQLDYQIRHLLLDEFQDTSQSQVELVKRLTDGWESEPDRSLFIVGDPMQSIYRFREAEVKLFLDAWQQGIGGIRLDTLRLSANFRSDPAVVDWFNRAFAQIFPATDDTRRGAVKFAASAPMLKPAAGHGVFWHLLPDGDEITAAECVVDIVRSRLQDWSTDETSTAGADERKIGILVRGRKHAVEIGLQLRAAGIAFTATGLEYMEEQSVVQDLVALTRAVLHPGDRIAWLACLRAPWCGLTLADLHALAAHNHELCIPTLATDQQVFARLSPTGRERLTQCLGVLLPAVATYGSVPLRDQIQSAWEQLGGPAILASDSDWVMVKQFFGILDTFDEAQADETELLRLLRDKTITRGDPASRVAIMTIHKAKGLEFDTVILPGLSRATRQTDKPPLLFHEFDPDHEQAGLVVAPIGEVTEDEDPIHRMLWNIERERERLELVRLIYVAVTRAQRHLHLLAGLTASAADDPTPRVPAANTMLGKLWPAAADDIDQALDKYEQQHGAAFVPPFSKRGGQAEREMNFAAAELHRLPDAWQRPEPAEPCGLVLFPERDSDEELLHFDWASPWAKHVGTVVHRWLQQIAEEGVERWDASRIEATTPAFMRALRRAGVGRRQLEAACERTQEAIRSALSDDQGRWLLSQHKEARNEYPLVANDSASGLFRKNIIDRTFVSDDDVRWIIDYKTGTHESRDVDAFLRNEALRYQPQLQRYREAFAALEDRSIQTALYFPLLRKLYLVDCDDVTASRSV